MQGPTLMERTFAYAGTAWRVDACGKWSVRGVDYFHFATPTPVWLPVDEKNVPQELMRAAGTR